MKKYNLHGIIITSLQIMRFNKYLEKHNISMNTKTKKERTDIVNKFINETKNN